jgi:hypothetical protein
MISLTAPSSAEEGSLLRFLSLRRSERYHSFSAEGGSQSKSLAKELFPKQFTGPQFRNYIHHSSSIRTTSLSQMRNAYLALI